MLKTTESTEIKNNSDTNTWLKPNEVLALHRFKKKKKALQARITGNSLSTSLSCDESSSQNLSKNKRKNPFAK